MTYIAHYIPRRHANLMHRDRGVRLQERPRRSAWDTIKRFIWQHDNDAPEPGRMTREQQTRQELRAAGLGPLNMLTIESHNIHKLLHVNEHIRAAICGRSNLRALPALIVATNLRVIYLHRIPLFTTMDEIPYDLVSGVSYNRVGPWYAAVTLHTRNGDYELTFVNLKSANQFIETIETSSIDSRAVSVSTSGMLKNVI